MERGEKMRNTIALFIILTSFVFAFATITGDLPNLQQIRYQVFTSGQPTNVGYSHLAAMGVQTVINVLPEKECLPGEDSMVRANHMVYFNQPFEPTDLKRKTVEEFAVMLKSVEKPVLIHCSTGNHVGGIWFAYRVLVEKAPLATALKEARRIGIQPEMENAVFNWVTSGAKS
jgi:uncharacterized protein (TIGR01244 family)